MARANLDGHAVYECRTCGSRFALFCGVQILERHRKPEGGWADETLPGNGPRRGESHPFDGLLRKIHELLNPPRPQVPHQGSSDRGASEGGKWS